MYAQKFKSKAKTRRHASAFLVMITLLSLLLLETHFVRKNVCEKFCNLDDTLYEIIQSKSTNHTIHGYRAITSESKRLYQSIPDVRSLELSKESEAFADKVFQEKGTGYIDFQMPDEAWEKVDFGFVSFPSEIECSSESNESQIYLSSMISVSGFRPKLIEYFIEHYSKLGILNKNMLFTIQINVDVNVRTLQRVTDILSSRGTYFDVFLGNWSSEALMYHQAHKLLHCTKETDWIVVADSDEFHEYPGNNISRFLSVIEAEGYNLVNGIFLDRLARDGTLQDLGEKDNLYEKFPIGCRLHLLFNLGTPKKVMAFKGYLRINRGHHRLALCWYWNRRSYLHLTPWKTCPPERQFALKPFKKRLNVHHFKWMKGQYSATQCKARVWEGTKVEKSYRLVLHHLRRCNGICISNPKIKCARVGK